MLSARCLAGTLQRDTYDTYHFLHLPESTLPRIPSSWSAPHPSGTCLACTGCTLFPCQCRCCTCLLGTSGKGLRHWQGCSIPGRRGLPCR